MSLPAKITDGPADDTDPSFSSDGQLIAFASTASSLVAPTALSTPDAQGPGSAPNTTLLGTAAPGTNRNIFLIGGGGRFGFGTLAIAGGAPVTLSGTDNFGPAWSSTRSNPYTNPSPGSEYIAFARGSSPSANHDIYYLKVLQNTNAGGETSKSNESATTPLPNLAPVYQVNAGDTVAADVFTSALPGGGQNAYVSDTFVNPNGPIGFTVVGGTAETITPVPVVNTVNDPNTPTQIYLTDRNGASTYTFRNLTPTANYRVRLHLADPKDTAKAARVFTVSINGVVSTPLDQNGPNIDIVGQAQSAPGRIDGLVSDSTTAAPIGGATITATDSSGNVTTLTSAGTTTPDPGGAANPPVNYNGALVQGAYTITITAPGYNSASQVINVNSGAYTRIDFPLSNAAAVAVTGTVTDSNNVPQPNIPVIVTDNNTNLTLTTATTGANGTFSVTLPPTAANDKYDITASPAASTGLTVQTQQVTVPTTAPLTFTLASTSSTTVGTLGGLVTNKATTNALAGVTVTVKGAGNTTVAVLMTSGTVTSPAAPGGDGAKLNYLANLPVGSYTLVITEPGYATQTLQAAVARVAGPPVVYFTRADAVLVSPTVPLGQNTAVVKDFAASAAVQTFTSTGLFLQNGTITVGFNAVSGDPPIVEGIEILADSTTLDDGKTTLSGSGFGSLPTNFFFGVTGAAAAPHILSTYGGVVTGTSGVPTPQVTITFVNGGTSTPTSFNLYRSSAAAASVNRPPTSKTGTEGSIPYIASVPVVPLIDATGNPIRDPNSRQPEFTITDTGVTQGAEYFYQLTAVFQQTLTPESAPSATGVGGNAAVLLNTDDNAGETIVKSGKVETAQTGNSFNDVYPTWSPFVNVFSIAYSSNRTTTYSDPVTNRASETALSVAPGGNLSTTGAVGANYVGLLISQVVNLDPPTLLPYSGNEIVHVADQAGNTTRTGVTPGQKVTFVARLSDREAGINNTGNASFGISGAQVYLQIKNPNSKYQDGQGFEHKVFAKDDQYRFQSNNPTANNFLLQDSGSSAQLINGGGYVGTNRIADSNGQIEIYFNRGSIGGTEDAPGSPVPGPATNTSDTITIGRDGGGINSAAVFTKDGKPVTDPDTKAIVSNPPGGDPNLFIPWGPEFECQVVNPDFTANTDPNRPVGDTGRSDFRDPFYLAGVDDQQPFSGTPFGIRPTKNITDGNGAILAPAEWLQMTRLPDSQQDGQGGVLYTVTWTTPATGSDYYLDVIAYDQAKAPGVSNSSGNNWRIYDNVWGFSSSSSIGNNDILVVSDYALGQKFAATTFGGQRGLLNLVPKLFGAESYVTDVDVNILPNAVYRHTVITGASPDAPSTEVQRLGTEFSPTGRDLDSFNQGPNSTPPLLQNPVFNGLGVGSYYDRFIDDGQRIDSVPAVRSQQYSIWRILSRGPVPDSVYAAYQPTPAVTQPAVKDTTAPTPVNIAAGPTTVANRCIVWISPFTGDVLAGPGTLADTKTQSSLRAFVKGGGRLCVSGEDVASSLTQNGQLNTAGGFVYDVLNAALTTANGGTHIPTVVAKASVLDNRITNTPNYDGVVIGNYPELNPGITTSTVPPGQRLLRISNNYGGNIFSAIGLGSFFVNYFNYGGNWRTDGSLDQLGPYIQPFPEGLTNSNSVVSAIDTVKPNATAHTDITLAPFTNPIPPVDVGNDAAASGPGGIGLIYTESPLSTTGGTGSKVVYATFGLEALSTEYYKVISVFKPNPLIFNPRNQRQSILHNIVDYLRTGSIAGTIRSTSGNGVAGSGIAGVTVYVQSAYGTAIPGRGTFSATTDSNGNFKIDGIEPGNYTLAAYRTGFVRATSNPGVVFVVEGDTLQQASLTMTPSSPGSITGSVKDSSGTGVASAAVNFTSTDGQNYTTTTDSNGNYSLGSVAPSTYTGTATKTGFTSQTPSPIVIASNTPTVVNFVLQPGPGTLIGRVLDPNGKPITGASVFVSSGSPAKIIATLTTDATGTYTSTTLTGGTYTLTATAAGFGTSGAVSVTITGGNTTTVPDIQLGAIQNGTLGGLVTGATNTTAVSGVTITITNTGTGQAVTPAPVTVASTSTGTDGSAINYGPISLPAGTYTVAAAKNGVSAGTQTITIAANSFSRVDFTGISGLPALHTFSAGLNFLSLPYNYTGTSFDTIFGALNTAPTGTTPNGVRSHVAVWDPTAGAYALDPTPPADALRLGIGYWIYLKNPVVLTQSGGTPSGAVSVALHPSWNQIGVPSTSGVLVSNLSFQNGTKTMTFAAAAGSANHVVSPTLYRYDGTTYQPVASTDTLQPYQAYWIKVYVNTTLLIPSGS